MSVVAKAVELLSYFSPSRPEIGLSQLCRLAKRDKATTYRHLSALEEVGLIEKNPATRAYRIGPAALHLAELREATVPRREVALPALDALADSTGETAHISVLSGKALHKLVARESTHHAIRAVVDVNVLPLHATASGICALAFGPADLHEAALQNLTRYTQRTSATPQSLQAAVIAARQSGFGTSDRGFEDDIFGLAAPIFDETDRLAGTVAVASVASRVTPEAEANIKRGLIRAAREITRQWGGSMPNTLLASWSAQIRDTEALDVMK